MIISVILCLALSLSPSLSMRFPRSPYAKSRSVKWDFRPVQMNKYAVSTENLGNTNIRREGPAIQYYRGPSKGHKVKRFDMNGLGLDNLKSLVELDEPLANYLALDTQGKQNNVKKNVGFKAVNINDFDADRQKSKISNHKKVKLVQSLAPPQIFFKKYTPNRIIKSSKSVDSSQNTYANDFANMVKHDRKPKSKSIFDENGMMYLTKPKDVKGRKLTNLINKVMQIKAEQELHGGLRQLENKLTSEELKEIQLIAQAIDAEERDDEDNDELDQLLLQELLQEPKKGSAMKTDLPLEIVVAELSPNTKEIKKIKVLPNTLNIKDILKLQIRESNSNDEIGNSEINSIAQLISQVVDQQKFDDDEDDDSTLTNDKVDIVKLPALVPSPITSHHKNEDKLKQIARAIQESQQDAKPDAAPSGTAHQFNFEDLVA